MELNIDSVYWSIDSSVKFRCDGEKEFSYFDELAATSIIMEPDKA